MDRIVFVVVHFNTQRLLRLCISSLLECYKDADILIVDNGSDDTKYLEMLSIHNDNISCLFNPTNLTHGPTMHQAVHLCRTNYIFFLDSDCIVRKRGFIEEMLKVDAYAVGDIQLVNKEGINIPGNTEDGIRYVHPSSMLIDKKQYLSLPPFIRHGAPCIENMTEANRIGLVLVDFPVGKYISHVGRGTREGLDVNWNGEEKSGRLRKWLRL